MVWLPASPYTCIAFPVRPRLKVPSPQSMAYVEAESPTGIMMASLSALVSHTVTKSSSRLRPSSATMTSTVSTTVSVPSVTCSSNSIVVFSVTLGAINDGVSVSGLFNIKDVWLCLQVYSRLSLVSASVAVPRSCSS